jgi:hypothetical protein
VSVIVRVVRSAQIRTVVLGLILALLVVPFGGPYTVPGLVAIAAIVGFDLWRQQLRVEAAARGEAPRETFADRPAAQRLGIVVGGSSWSFWCWSLS